MRHSPGHLRPPLVANDRPLLGREAQRSERLHRALADALCVLEVHGGRDVTVVVGGDVESEVVLVNGVEIPIELLLQRAIGDEQLDRICHLDIKTSHLEPITVMCVLSWSHGSLVLAAQLPRHQHPRGCAGRSC